MRKKYLVIFLNKNYYNFNLLKFICNFLNIKYIEENEKLTIDNPYFNIRVRLISVNEPSENLYGLNFNYCLCDKSLYDTIYILLKPLEKNNIFEI